MASAAMDMKMHFISRKLIALMLPLLLLCTSASSSEYPEPIPVDAGCFSGDKERDQSTFRGALPNVTASSVEELQGLLGFQGPPSIYLDREGRPNGVIRANILLTSEEYLLDEPLLLELNSSFAGRQSDINFVFAPGGEPAPGRAVLRCNKAGTALRVRADFGAGLLRGYGVVVTGCNVTAVVVETRSLQEVEAAFAKGMSYDKVPLVQLRGFDFIDNTGADGGALRVHGATLNLRANEFHNNTAVRGAAVMLKDQATANLWDSNCFGYNRVTWAGGPGRGGAVHLEADSCVKNLTGNMFFGNMGAQGGAVFIGGQTPRCSRVKPLQNVSVDPQVRCTPEDAEHPTCHWREVFSMELENEYHGNHAYLDGGALYVVQEMNDLNAHLKSFASYYINNTAARRGGAAYCQVENGAMFLADEIVENFAGGAGGAVYCTSPKRGGFCWFNESKLENNWVQTGAGVVGHETQLLEPLPLAEQGSGGALHMNAMADVRVAFSSLVGNMAETKGGALHCSRCIFATMESTSYNDNSAAAGGALDFTYLFGGGVIKNCSFDSNRAVVPTPKLSPALEEVLNQTCGLGGGGALCMQTVASTFTITEVNFTNNEARIGGAGFFDTAICVASKTPCPLTLGPQVLVEDNTATLGGAGFYFTDLQSQEEVSQCIKTPGCPNITFRGNGISTGGVSDIYSRPSRMNITLASREVANEEPFDVLVGLQDDLGQPVIFVDQDIDIRVIPLDPNADLKVKTPQTSMSSASALIGNVSMYGDQVMQEVLVEGRVRGQMALSGNFSIRLRECIVGEVISMNQRLCQRCQVPYGTSYSFNPRNNTCDSCPEHCNCADAGYFYPMYNPNRDSYGYWHSHPRSVQIHRCPLKGSCVARNADMAPARFGQLRVRQNILSRMLGPYPYVSNITNLRVQDQEALLSMSSELVQEYMVAQCAEGYQGVLCGTCQSGWGRLRQSCKKCFNLVVSVLLYLVSLMVDFLILSILMFLRLRRRRVALEEASKLTHGQALDIQPPGAASDYPSRVAQALLGESETDVEVAPPFSDVSQVVLQSTLDRAPMVTSRSTGSISGSSSWHPSMPSGADVDALGDQGAAPDPKSKSQQSGATYQTFLTMVTSKSTTSAQSGGALTPGAAGVPIDPLDHQEYTLAWTRSQFGGLMAQIFNPTAASKIEEAAPAIFEVIMVYVQMISTLMRINSNWPGFALNFFDIVTVSSSRLTWASVDCLVPNREPWTRAMTRILMVTLTPVGIGLLLLAFWFLLYLLRHPNAMTSKRKFAFDIVFAVVAQELLYYYTVVTTVLLTLFSCNQVDKDIDVPYKFYRAAMGRFWSQEYSTPCYEGPHFNLTMMYGIPALSIFSVLLPLLILAFLIYNRKRLWNVKFRFTYGMLYENYRKRYYWWAIMNFAFLLGLAAVVELLRHLAGVVQLVAYMAIATVFLCLHLHHFPYRSVLLNGLSCLTMYAALFSAYLILIFESNWLQGTRARQAVIVVIMAGNTFVLLVLIVHFVAAAMTYVQTFGKNLSTMFNQMSPPTWNKRSISTKVKKGQMGLPA